MGERHGTDLLGAAVSPLVAGAVSGGATRRRVLGVFATCVYVELGAHDRVLALLASDALHLPIGLRLAVPSAALSWGVEPGDEVVVGVGRVLLPSYEIVAARLARPSRVRATSWLPTPAGAHETPHGRVVGATREGGRREVAGEVAEHPGVGETGRVGRGRQPARGSDARRPGETRGDDLVRRQHDPPGPDDHLVARLDAPGQSRRGHPEPQADGQVQRVGGEQREHPVMGAELDVDTGREDAEHPARSGGAGDRTRDER